MGSWFDLPGDLILSLAKYTTTKDQILLRAVCSHWDTQLKQNPVKPCNQLPWLLVPKQDPCCGFYSLSEDKFYQLDVPEAYVYRCCGSSEGWFVMCHKTPALFMMNPFTGSRIELPPVTSSTEVLDYCVSNVGKEYNCKFGVESAKISSKYMERYWMRKVILTGNPSIDKDCIVIALYGSIDGQLGFCKVGDATWTDVHQPDRCDYLCDIIYWKGLIYGVSPEVLIQCDLRGPTPVVKKLVDSKTSKFGDNRTYLVVSSDELLMVAKVDNQYTEEELKDISHCGGHCLNDPLKSGDNRYYEGFESFYEEEAYQNAYYFYGREEQEHQNFPDDDGAAESDDEPYYESDDFVEYSDEGNRVFGTTCFRVYRPNTETKTWTRVRNIGDKVLFIGNNSSLSFDARDFPECKPNHIYFTNDQNPSTVWGWTWEQDLGAMDLETNKVQRFPGCSRAVSLLRPAPSWITPSLY